MCFKKAKAVFCGEKTTKRIATSVDISFFVHHISNKTSKMRLREMAVVLVTVNVNIQDSIKKDDTMQAIQVPQ